jgi:hypothetical protein
MEDITILTQYQLNKLLEGTQDVKVYGTHDNGVIGLGNGANSENIEAILTHEEIHNTLRIIFPDYNMSFAFDRDLIYNNEVCKHTEFFKNITVREALIGIFEDIVILI